jgi:hypothetical protein
MHIRAGHKGDWYAGFSNAFGELGNRSPDCRTAIVIDARQDVWSASNRIDAIGRCHSRHRQRHGEVFRAVVNSRQQVGVQIDQVVARFSQPVTDYDGTAIRPVNPVVWPF